MFFLYFLAILYHIFHIIYIFIYIFICYSIVGFYGYECHVIEFCVYMCSRLHLCFNTDEDFMGEISTTWYHLSPNILPNKTLNMTIIQHNINI